MLAHDGPALLDVVTAKQELSMPPTITAEQVKGFSLWVLRAVMSGRGDEVIDLAKTNLLRANAKSAALRRRHGQPLVAALEALPVQHDADESPPARSRARSGSAAVPSAR